MPNALVVLVALGLLALLLDLGGRLFGTYAQTPLRAASRITIVTAACFALMAPALISFALEEGSSPRGLWFSAGLGLVAVLHFLFPFRFGIRRSSGDSPAQVQPLIPGMQIRAETFASKLIPAAADGLECLVLSDLHCNTRHKLELLRRIVETLKNETVDCVFVLGDLGEKNALIPDVLAAIAQLPHKHGTFLVRSNHDFEGGRDEVVEQTAAEHSIRVLANDAATLPDLGICLLGLEYPWNQQGTPSPPDGTFTIGLTHTPDNLTHFARLHVSLSVAGHTHGGKIRLPWIGPLLVPSKFGRLLDYGWFRTCESRMFVTKGIGYFPGLFGSRGEVLKLRLKRIP
ncbi:MAG: hypothetical protein GXX96_30240 [Planctomycetaceae bacterium]|nr:hypothetical protein [Planctomycetaceae bacterium]